MVVNCHAIIDAATTAVCSIKERPCCFMLLRHWRDFILGEADIVHSISIEGGSSASISNSCYFADFSISSTYQYLIYLIIYRHPSIHNSIHTHLSTARRRSLLSSHRSHTRKHRWIIRRQGSHQIQINQRGWSCPKGWNSSLEGIAAWSYYSIVWCVWGEELLVFDYGTDEGGRVVWSVSSVDIWLLYYMLCMFDEYERSELGEW